MNIDLNEWLEINTSQTVGELAQKFISPTSTVLYPKVGEEFRVRLLGKMKPYYRAYISPNDLWYVYCDSKEIKSCLAGDVKTILKVAKSLLEKTPSLAATFEINYEKEDIVYKSDFCASISSLVMNISPAGSNKLGSNSVANQITISDSDSKKINFLQSCLKKDTPSLIWHPCLISNAFVRIGSSRCQETIQVFVITKNLFRDMVFTYAAKNNKKISDNNISGINSYDIKVCKEQINDGNPKSPKLFKPQLKLRIDSEPNSLTYDEISKIVNQKLVNISTYMKQQNDKTFESMGGFVYRPLDSDRDFDATQAVIEGMEMANAETDEQYESAEKEICNIPDELVYGNTYENGPISGIEID